MADEYEATLGYLEYGSASSRISIPMQIRERHLTPETDSAELQAIGPELQITIWSERDNIIIRVPLGSWRCSGTYSASLSGANKGHITVGRFEDEIANEGDELPATIAIHEFDEPQ